MRKRTRTRWRRFAVAAVPATAVTAVVMAGIANGAVPVALNVSGQTFKVSADRLVGDGFDQYGSMVVTAEGEEIPVAVSDIKSAELTNLCQSVPTPGLPFTLVIRAGGGDEPVEATNLTIGMNELRGDATFENIDIGVDASQLTKGGGSGRPGDIGQEADSVRIENLQQKAYSTHAGTFTLNGLSMKVSLSGEECFDW
ncbi:hypothetical protein CLV30_12052 [Haloactinopolyspora alba]|uniref:Cholesterol esterase n=1 Tax=Haloactinopolyspora alba TaxID=648780 RepID=A0A2P8DM27_9ACTN|nr:hypothetical protein CLV30_12052 [Haloactinopolyspora alba]